MMAETCENRCENCVYTERGYDEYSHQVYAISKECPIYENTLIFYRVNHRNIPVELMTNWCGCNHFVLDTEYQKQCEETEKFIEDMNKQRAEKRTNHDKNQC